MTTSDISGVGHFAVTLRKRLAACKNLAGPARHEPITEKNSQLIAGLMKAIGLAPRRQREVGCWIIDEQPLADGEGWQE